MARAPAVPAGIAAVTTALVLGPALATTEIAGQEPESNVTAFSVELRVELRDYFPGPWSDGEAGTWRVRYLETGRWRFERAAEGLPGVDMSGRHSVQDLEASASPIMVDACGHQWVRHWTDPARVEFRSEVEAELVLDGNVVAIWYVPVRPSLQDPGGPKGKGDCADPDDVDDARRRTLVFDPSDLRDRIDTESGLPAVGPDGRILLALVPWTELVSGELVRRRVTYGEGRLAFRARLELVPEPALD